MKNQNCPLTQKSCDGNNPGCTFNHREGYCMVISTLSDINDIKHKLNDIFKQLDEYSLIFEKFMQTNTKKRN
jgi:hypothetical protein